ncbi:MAG: hypothetical protein RSH26_01410 [Clostridia bacterium]
MRKRGRDKHQMPAAAQSRNTISAALNAEQYAQLEALRRQK